MQPYENSHRVSRPLSPIEQGLLFHYFYETESVYVDQMVCDIVGQLDASRFEEALQRLAAIHESLRTCYVRGAGAEVTAVIRTFPTTRITRVDLSAEPNPRATVSRRVAMDAKERFDLSKDVSRCALYRLDERLHVFAWTYHHVVADSWTLRLLQEQFCGIYRALLGSAEYEGLKATPYGAYVDWVATQDRSSVLHFWASYLERFKSRRPMSVAASGASSDGAYVRITLPLETRKQIDHVRRRCKVTTNVVLLGMWGILALDGQQTQDCLLGCVVTGRTIPVRGIETVAGVCANTVPIVIDGAKSIQDLFTELQRDIFGATSRSQIALSDVLASSRLSHRHLHSVVNFTIDERTVQNQHIDHLPFDITNVRYSQAANFDAYLDIESHDTGVEITIHFDPARREFVAGEVSWKCERIVQYFAHDSAGTVRDLLDALLIQSGQFDVEFAFDAPTTGGSSI